MFEDFFALFMRTESPFQKEVNARVVAFNAGHKGQTHQAGSPQQLGAWFKGFALARREARGG